MDSSSKEIVLEGVAASPGVAHGPAFVVLQHQLDIPVFHVNPAHWGAEVKRFEEALIVARKQLSELRNAVAKQLGEDEARIFDMHLMVLEDKALIDETIREFEKSRYNIEFCFREVSGTFVEGFAQIDDPYLRERVKDLQDVTRRVLGILIGKASKTFADLSSQHIIVTEDIPPSEAAMLEKGKVFAITTDVGSRTSHAVIVARSLGIPAVVGLHNISSLVNNEDVVLVDGYDGFVYINPSRETLFRYGQLKEERLGIERIFKSESQKPSESRDGRRIHLGVNIGGPEECHAAIDQGADGVGLFRTEAFFMKSGRFPSEDQQYAVYKSATERMNPRTVIMRTLDMGGDKQFSSIGFNLEEKNPFMGFRAIRFCLEHKDIFKEQLRAILRASAFGKVKIMFPMISSVSQFLSARELVEECKQELSARGQAYDERIPVGTMVEVPSAAIIADQLAQCCDFFSIGTNDLIQYLLAVDRVNDRIAHLYQPSHPAVLRTLKAVFDAGKRNGIPVGVCGEMAADPFYVPFMIGAGASEISVSLNALAEIKYLIRRIEYSKARKIVHAVLEMNDPRTIQTHLHDFFHEIMAELVPQGYYRRTTN